MFYASFRIFYYLLRDLCSEGGRLSTRILQISLISIPTNPLIDVFSLQSKSFWQICGGFFVKCTSFRGWDSFSLDAIRLGVHSLFSNVAALSIAANIRINEIYGLVYGQAAIFMAKNWSKKWKRSGVNTCLVSIPPHPSRVRPKKIKFTEAPSHFLLPTGWLCQLQRDKGCNTGQFWMTIKFSVHISSSKLQPSKRGLDSCAYNSRKQWEELLFYWRLCRLWEFFVPVKFLAMTHVSYSFGPYREVLPNK